MPVRPVGCGGRWRVARGCRCPLLDGAVGRRGPHDRLDVHVLAVPGVVDRQIPALAADDEFALPVAVADTRDGRSRCRASGTRTAARGVDRRRLAVPVDQVVLERSRRSGCPGATRSLVDRAHHFGSRRPSPPSTGATTPVSCHRRPSPNSLTSKWVDNVAKFTGAHSQKNCGRRPGAPAGPRSPTGRTPHDRSRDPHVSPAPARCARRRARSSPPSCELGEAGVVEHHADAGPRWKCGSSIGGDRERR